jgi:hypothetical protein
MRRLQRALSAAVVAGIVLHAAPVLAPIHVLVIEQIFFGTDEAPNAQYVVLRTLAPFQVFVDNQKISNQDATGAAAGEFGEFEALTEPDIASGVAIIMGTAEAEDLFGITMDHVTSGQLVFPDGRICFGDFGGPVDCVAYGAFTGANPGAGAPAPAPVRGMALVRVSMTNNDANDFQLGAPCPQNNDGERGTTCPTPTPTLPPPPSASATATPTTRPTPPLTDYVCPGDCDRNRTAAVNEVVSAVNIALERASVDTCLQADVDRDGNVRVNELVGSVGSVLNGCPALGTRRFSLNTATSTFTAVLNIGSFPSVGFEGFLELTAGVPNTDGVALINLTDASDFLSIEIPPQAGGDPVVVCIRPRKDLFPVTNAGAIDCDGGTAFGFSVTQDHNLGMVSTCTAGDNAGEACDADDDCPGGECFSTADCDALNGLVEGPLQPHPGVCNGPLQGAQFGDNSGVGAVFIGRDEPTRIFNGLPAVLTTETALPCGDEGTGMDTVFAFTTGISRGIIVDFANQADQTFMHEITGTNFSCRDWAEEDSAGTLVLDVPTLDLEVPILGPQDFISAFSLDD